MNRLKDIYTFFYLYILLTMFDLELSRRGFNNTFEKYKRKYMLKRTIQNEQDFKKYSKEIFRVFDMLDIVCAWYPKKADCIHKTFLGYKIIRKKYLIPVDMVVGIRKFPFEAHAWLQCNNINFFGEYEETSRYKIILRSNNLEEGD